MSILGIFVGDSMPFVSITLGGAIGAVGAVGAVEIGLVGTVSFLGAKDDDKIPVSPPGAAPGGITGMVFFGVNSPEMGL